jgi:hypothetical protein
MRQDKCGCRNGTVQTILSSSSQRRMQHSAVTRQEARPEASTNLSRPTTILSGLVVQETKYTYKASAPLRFRINAPSPGIFLPACLLTFYVIRCINISFIEMFYLRKIP